MGDRTAIWTLPQVCELLGLNGSQIHRWLRLGYFKPAVAAPAKGRPNLFCFNDLVKLAVLAKMGEFRMLSVGSAATLVGYLDFGKVGPQLRIGPVHEGASAWETKLERNPRGDEDVVFVINIDAIRNRVRSKLK